MKIDFLEIKFENWKFGKLDFDIKIRRIKKNEVWWWAACPRWPCVSGPGLLGGSGRKQGVGHW